MGDFIKELTIIDFLGMLVPGSLLVLLFSYDFNVKNIWCGYFEQNPTADTIILLIVGYLVGMVLHEIGDLFEKVIWKTNIFSPRYYAAKKVFGKSSETTSYTLLGTHTFPIRSKAQSTVLLWITSALSCAVLVIFFMMLFALPIYLQLGSHWIVLFSLFIFAGLLSWSYFIVIKTADNNIIDILIHNAAIQTIIYGKGTASKRQIFDGFYCVMRNLLLAVGIVNSYALAFSETSNGDSLAYKIESFYHGKEKLLIYSVIVCFMAARCYHSAYLKYKYGYEDFLYLIKCKKEASQQTKSTEQKGNTG